MGRIGENSCVCWYLKGANDQKTALARSTPSGDRAYSEIETIGGRLSPTAEVLLRFVEKFGKTPDWMLTGKSQLAGQASSACA